MPKQMLGKEQENSSCTWNNATHVKLPKDCYIDAKNRKNEQWTNKIEERLSDKYVGYF